MKVLNKDALMIHYVKQGLSLEQVAILLGTSRKTVRKNLDDYGIPVRRSFIHKKMPDKKELELYYIKMDYSWVQMCDKYKISNETFNRWINTCKLYKKKRRGRDEVLSCISEK